MYQVVLAFCFVKKKFIKFIRLSSDFSMACNQGLPFVKNICGPQLNDTRTSTGILSLDLVRKIDDLTNFFFSLEIAQLFFLSL